MTMPSQATRLLLLLLFSGSWMTFYLMFQFCYMVLGILYATWRVVLAVVVMLLFSVSALDRSLLMMFKVRGLSTDSAAAEQQHLHSLQGSTTGLDESPSTAATTGTTQCTL